MKKLLQVIVATLLVVLLITIIWFFSLRTTTGYVVTELESNPHGDLLIENIWVVELESDKTEGKTKTEIIEAVQEQADISRYLEQADMNDPGPGTIYRIPLINRELGTKFNIGDKVKVYWGGTVMESLPSPVDGTVLVIKIGD